MASSYNNAYIVAPDQLDSAVQTITAGSNITITGTSTNPIINATQWPSVFGSKTANSGVVGVNAVVSLFSIANSYFSDPTRRYLLTVNFGLNTGTFASAATGNVTILTDYNSATLMQQPMTFNNITTWTGTSNVNFSGSMSTTFLPTVNAPLIFYIENNTNVSLTTTSVACDISITGLTTSNISANNWP